jgi:hypothetical protein
LISGDDSETGNLVEIMDSGIIEVTEGETDAEEDEEDGDDAGDEEGEGNSYNTDSEPYRRTLSDDDSVTVNSST